MKKNYQASVSFLEKAHPLQEKSPLVLISKNLLRNVDGEIEDSFDLQRQERGSDSDVKLYVNKQGRRRKRLKISDKE